MRLFDASTTAANRRALLSGKPARQAIERLLVDRVRVLEAATDYAATLDVPADLFDADEFPRSRDWGSPARRDTRCGTQPVDYETETAA
jgi:hypothetical protein